MNEFGVLAAIGRVWMNPSMIELPPPSDALGAAQYATVCGILREYEAGRRVWTKEDIDDRIADIRDCGASFIAGSDLNAAAS